MAGNPRFVHVLSLSLLGACAGSPGATPSSSGSLHAPDEFVTYFRADALPHRGVVRAPVDAVWKALPAVFEDLGYPGAPAQNSRERVFITPNLQITGRLYEGESNSKYIDCGSGNAGPRADSYEVQFVIITRVSASSDTETLVETIIDGSARDRMVSGGSFRCTGTGTLEKAVVDLLMRRVSA